MAEIPPHMPTRKEILDRAIELFMHEHPGAPTPEEEELKEGNYWERARLDLMTGIRSELEKYLAWLESEADEIREELGIKKPLPTEERIRELEDKISTLEERYRVTRERLKEAREEIKRLEEKLKPPPPPPPPKPPPMPTCPVHKVELIPVIGLHEFPWGSIEVPSEMFLYQCPVEFEYYICEPSKRCELVSLDRLKLKLARIVKPIVAPPALPPMRVLPKGVVSLEQIRAEEAAIESHPRFPEYIAEMGFTMESYRVLDYLSKDALRKSFREWLEKKAWFRKE